jgi:uncharacterized paraquat-inducible protein A
VTATDDVILASIVVPVAVTIALAWVFLRGKKDDPDEQRWRRLAEQRREAAQMDSSDSDP